MQDFGHWTYTDDAIPENALGFIYKITHKASGKIYFGRKLLWFKIKRPPLKGKKRARREVKESDWKKYTSSSWQIKDILEKEGKEAFAFEILQFCFSKWELNWTELEIQVKHRVLHNPELYFNGIIEVRLSSAPKNLLDSDDEDDE